MGAAESSEQVTNLLSQVRCEVDKIVRELDVLQDAYTCEHNLVTHLAQERSDIRKERDAVQVLNDVRVRDLNDLEKERDDEQIKNLRLCDRILELGGGQCGERCSWHEGDCRCQRESRCDALEWRGE